MWKCSGRRSGNALSGLDEKMEWRANEPWITQEMVSKMDGRKWKNVSNEEGRKNYRE